MDPLRADPLHADPLHADPLPVPRETAAAARHLFGERLPMAELYAGHLAASATERGLIGPRESPRLWDRHLLNCAVVGELLAEGATVVDVGSGAGLPGIALALARPDVQVVLLEPLLRRAVWLAQVLEELELANVSVRRARAQEVAGTIRCDVTTARGVAPLERLVPWSIPLLHGGGELLALKGRSAAEELERVARDLPRWGAASWDIVTVGTALLTEPTTVVRVRVGADPRRDRTRRART